MAVRNISKHPAPVLKNKTVPVSKFDDELKNLVKDMFDTMYVSGGVGLSANQVGVSLRVAVINPTGGKKDELALINPEIVGRKGSAAMEEGCLSLPGANAAVKRAGEIEVTFADLEGNRRRLTFNGLPARIVQHELDHLSGLLFVDRLSFLKRRSLLRKTKH